MKIVFYNESILSGGIEKCIELLSKSLPSDYEIEVVYVDDTVADKNIIEVLSKNASVHKLEDNEIINADICVWCRIYLDYAKLSKQIVAKRNILWVHSKPRALPNCILDDKEAMASFEKIICVSEAVKNEVNFPDKSIVIHNFINEDIHELAEAIQNPFSDIQSDYLKLLIVARLSYQKGFDRVKKVVDDLIKLNKKFELKVIGNGRKAEPVIRSMFEGYQQVEFLGYQQNPYPYIKNCDYLLVLSDYETWGNVITEAKALGTPCIVADFPSAKEQIDNGINGLLLPLECDSYCEYIKDLSDKQNVIKSNLKNFKYVNEIDKWFEVFNN